MARSIRRWRNSAISRVRWAMYRVWIQRKLQIEIPCDELGTGYGRWLVPTILLRPSSVCYLAGVGEDTQLDESLAAAGHQVYSFDPTPRAVQHAERAGLAAKGVRFQGIGIWESDCVVHFFSPIDPTHVSHSVTNLQKTVGGFEAPVRTIPSLMAELGHTKLDLVKLDIEGAEHAVVRQMLSAGVTPTVLCVEFDQPDKLSNLLRTSRLLTATKYVPIAIDRWNVTWVRIP